MLKYFGSEIFVTEIVRGSMSTETMHKLLKLLRYVRHYGRKVHKEGLGGRRISALRYLMEAGPLTVGQLRDYLYISDSSTSEMIDHLQEVGYVTRTRSVKDNRVVIVALTPAGKVIAEETPLGGIPLLREKLKTLPPERLSVIDAALTELIQLLEIEDEC